jgi:hypothetical protein
VPIVQRRSRSDLEGAVPRLDIGYSAKDFKREASMTESGLNPECLIVTPIFIRGSQGAIEAFCSLGYAIYILDVNIKTDYLEFCNGGLPKRQLGKIVKESMLEIPQLVRIQIYAHARHDINLTGPGAELSATPISERQPHVYDPHRVFIGGLRIGKPGVAVGMIDLFTCMTCPSVACPQLMADATGWPVRTVAPGYSIYFPSDSRYPRSKLPSTGLLWLSNYDPAGWSLWIPGWSGWLSVSEPNEMEHHGTVAWLTTQSLKRRFAESLERVREWRRTRKRRRAIRA